MAIERHVLLIACTRPAMKWGVPLEAWSLNSFGVLFFGMFMDNPAYWFLMVPGHFILAALTNKNPNFFREWRVWFKTRAAVPGAILWTLPHSPSPTIPGGTLYAR